MGCIWIYLFNPPNNTITVDTNMITTTGKFYNLKEIVRVLQKNHGS